MAYLTMATLVFGVFLAAVSGLICYLGTGSFQGRLDWIPHVNLLFSHPAWAFGTGAAVIVASILCQPSRIR